MRTWTNITIRNRFDRDIEKMHEIELLNFKIEQQQRLINSFYNEFENIFESLKQNKKITLSYEKEKIVAILFEEIEQSGKAGELNL